MKTEKSRSGAIFVIICVLILAGPFIFQLTALILSSVSFPSLLDDIVHGLSGVTYAAMNRVILIGALYFAFYLFFMYLPVLGIFAWAAGFTGLFLKDEGAKAVRVGLPMAGIYTAMMYAVSYYMITDIYSLPMAALFGTALLAAVGYTVFCFIYLRRRFGLEPWKRLVCCIVPMLIFTAGTGALALALKIFYIMMSV